MTQAEIKFAAIEMRQRIETMTGRLWSRTIDTPVDEIYHSNIRHRLMLAVTYVDEGNRHEAYVAARASLHVYSDTSDVLHGRLRAANVNQSRVDEWRTDVERLERLLS